MPGIDGTGNMFSSLTSHWCSREPYLCIAYPASLSARLEAYVEHVAQQITSLDRVVLVAESFSGPIAILLAAKLGQRLAGLLLCASFATTPHPLVGLARRCPAVLIEHGKRQAFLLRRYCVGSNAEPDLVQRLSNTLRGVDSATLTQRLAVLERLDVRSSLRELVAPILLLQAGHERLLSGPAVRNLVVAAPQATVESIDGPHLLLEAKPKVCFQAMARWSAGYDFALGTFAA